MESTNSNDWLAEFSKFEPFNPTTCSWPAYAERMLNYFELYNVPNDKRGRILVDRINNATYEKLRELCEPVLPMHKPFDELSEIMEKHFNPYSNKFRERVKFTRRVQRAKENTQKYGSELKKWGKNCKFPEFYFQEALITQFLNGIRSEQLRTKLIEMNETDFDKIVETAFNLEAVMTPAKEATPVAVKTEPTEA